MCHRLLYLGESTCNRDVSFRTVRLRNLGVHNAGKQFSGLDGSVFFGSIVTLLSSESYRNDRNWELEISCNAWYSRLHTHTLTHTTCVNEKYCLPYQETGTECIPAYLRCNGFSRTMYGVSQSIWITRLGIIVGSIYTGLEKVTF